MFEKGVKLIKFCKKLFKKIVLVYLKKKKFLVVKNRVLGKGQYFKIFQFLTQNISVTTNVENPKKFLRTTNLLENMQKNFGGHILNKNTSQKNSRGGGRAFFPPPQSVNVRFKRN